MKMNLDVVYNDGSTAAASVAAVDFVVFEETYDRSVAKFQTELKFTDLCWLAWHALSRKQKDLGDFHAWLENVESVMFGEDSEIVPLESTASIGQ
jgi:hypothetical protein